LKIVKFLATKTVMTSNRNPYKMKRSTQLKYEPKRTMKRMTTNNPGTSTAMCVKMEEM
jgi:hypothetical protein